MTEINQALESTEVPSQASGMDTDSNGNEPVGLLATIAHAGQPMANLKQVEDVKFAMSVVAAGKLTENELAESLMKWTAFGNIPLSEHLVSIGKLSAQDADTIQKAASDTDVAEPKNPVGNESKHPSPEKDGIAGKTVPNENQSHGVENGTPAVSLEFSRFAQTLGFDQTPKQEESQVRRVGSEYRLIRKLGQGGLGSVWLAKDEVLDRSVAIKELNEGITSQQALERFRREARVTGQLDHPNIVTVHQYGSDTTTGKAFYAMRFVGKKTLADAITEYHDLLESGQDATSQLNQMLSAFQMVCQAIAFAHSRGVIHRDLKPENVALDNFGQVSVIDWGLAKSLHEAEIFDGSVISGDGAQSVADQTQVGQIVGTPLYMSPEQASGRIDDIDERTDVYGLGAILFHILAGRAPHLPGSYQSGSRRPDDSSRVESILDSIMENPTPSVVDVRPQAPPDLSGICEKAMARKKSRRYGSAIDLAAAVKNWVDGIADRTRRFELLKSQAREIEMRIRSTATEISRDARFASSLPPIQGIIDILNEREDGNTLEQWRKRLESIFEAMLRTNQCLHSLGFAQTTSQEVTELVRVQRNMGDSAFIHCVPKSRLANVERSVCHDSLLKLDPGDVEFSIRPSEAKKSRAKSSFSGLSAWIPVFDQEEGHLFGLVYTEVDLEEVISDYLQSLDNVSNSIYVLDHNGDFWVSRHDKAHCTLHQRNKEFLQSKCPELEAVFDGSREILELESRLVARRVTFGLPGLGFEIFIVCIV